MNKQPQIEYRALQADDGEQLKALRQMAIKNDVVFSFTVDLQVECKRSIAEWTEMATETSTKVFFGAFHNGLLIGMVGAKPWAKGSDPKVAHWFSTYLCPEYRKLGIAQRLYQMREHWTINHGFKTAIFSLHAENERAISIHNAQGAKEISRELIRFGENNQEKAFALWYCRTFQP